MTLILAVVILLTVGVGSYLIAAGLYMVGYLLFGDVLWLDVVTYALVGVIGLLIVLPADQADSLLADIRALGVPSAIVGEMMEPGRKEILVTNSNK